MNSIRPPLPDFANPPVIEVALSVQFNPLTDLQAPQLGLLWSEFRSRFPKAEQQPPLDSVTEKFGVRRPGKVNVRFEMGVPVPRCWFLNEAGTELIQVQQDRFAHNWRKVGAEDKYPRYERICETFKMELDTFRQFLAREQLGELNPNQCEVTYVNHIVSGEGWEKHGQVGAVVTVWSSRYSDAFLSEPEDVRFAIRYVIRDEDNNPLGRLHISLEPAYRIKDDKLVFVLRLTARGKPEGEGLEGVFRFLDRGREWIVRGFASITTPSMHKVWERRDATR